MFVRKSRRRGTSTVQWVIIAAVTTIIIIAAVQGLGTQSNTRLEGTAGSVGNPADLKNMVDPQ